MTSIAARLRSRKDDTFQPEFPGALFNPDGPKAAALIERLTRAASIIVSMVDAGTLLVENDLAEAAMDELRAAYEDAKGEKG